MLPRKNVASNIVAPCSAMPQHLHGLATDLQPLSSPRLCNRATLEWVGRVIVLKDGHSPTNAISPQEVQVSRPMRRQAALDTADVGGYTPRVAARRRTRPRKETRVLLACMQQAAWLRESFQHRWDVVRPSRRKPGPCGAMGWSVCMKERFSCARRCGARDLYVLRKESRRRSGHINGHRSINRSRRHAVGTP